MSPRPPDHSDNDPTVPEPSDGTNPNGTAAERIIEKFGGIRPMAHKLNMPVTTVQGWKKRGAIPSNRHPDLLAAASRYNVTLDQAELDAAAPADERPVEESPTIIVSGTEPVATQSAVTPEPEQPADTTPSTPWTSPRSYDRPATASTTGSEPMSSANAPEAETPAEPIRATSEPVHAAEPAHASGGGKGLATFAILLALLGTGAAVTAPVWGPRVIPQVWPPQTPGGGDLSAQVAALDQRVQQLAARGSDTAPLNDRLAQLEQQLSALRQQSQQQPAASGEAAPAAPGLDQAQVEQIVQAQVQAQVQPLAGRLGALEQRPQPRPGIDQQALDARVVPLEQQLLAGSQIRARIQGLEGRLATLDQQGQAISRLNQSVAGGEQEANRLAQEISNTSTRSAKVAETLTLRQAEESKAQ